MNCEERLKEIKGRHAFWQAFRFLYVLKFMLYMRILMFGISWRKSYKFVITKIIIIKVKFVRDLTSSSIRDETFYKPIL